MLKSLQRHLFKRKLKRLRKSLLDELSKLDDIELAEIRENMIYLVSPGLTPEPEELVQAEKLPKKEVAFNTCISLMDIYNDRFKRSFEMAVKFERQMGRGGMKLLHTLRIKFDVPILVYTIYFNACFDKEAISDAKKAWTLIIRPDAEFLLAFKKISNEGQYNFESISEYPQEEIWLTKCKKLPELFKN